MSPDKYVGHHERRVFTADHAQVRQQTTARIQSAYTGAPRQGRHRGEQS